MYLQYNMCLSIVLHTYICKYIYNIYIHAHDPKTILGVKNNMSRQHLFSFTMIPAVGKIYSAGTEVAGITRYYLANMCSNSFHFSSTTPKHHHHGSFINCLCSETFQMMVPCTKSRSKNHHVELIKFESSLQFTRDL